MFDTSGVATAVPDSCGRLSRYVIGGMGGHGSHLKCWRVRWAEGRLATRLWRDRTRRRETLVDYSEGRTLVGMSICMVL
jgi:hypothetical protein